MDLAKFLDIINNIQLPDNLTVRFLKDYDLPKWIQIKQESICNRDNKIYQSRGRKWNLSSHMTESEIVFTIWKAILTFTEHELREKFHYKGKRIFDPHIDVNALLTVCGQLDTRKEI